MSHQRVPITGPYASEDISTPVQARDPDGSPRSFPCLYRCRGLAVGHNGGGYSITHEVTGAMVHGHDGTDPWLAVRDMMCLLALPVDWRGNGDEVLATFRANPAAAQGLWAVKDGRVLEVQVPARKGRH